MGKFKDQVLAMRTAEAKQKPTTFVQPKPIKIKEEVKVEAPKIEEVAEEVIEVIEEPVEAVEEIQPIESTFSTRKKR